MSTNKVLLIFQDGEERRVPLDKERLIIGRDKSCDVVLTGNAVSRKHAAITHKFGSVYLENISSTGKITKNGEAVEHVELHEGDEAQIGPYTLQWKIGEVVQEAAPMGASPDGFGLAAEPVPPVEAQEVSPMEEGAAPAEVALPVTRVSERAEPMLAVPTIDGEPVSAPEGDPVDFAVVTADEKTQVAASGARPVLKVTKGEVEGREIRLDNGVSWIVGRSARCHIQIDNQKLSRQHFKIIKIGHAYRIEDMGSANGTRLNGVAVTDAPLQSFDSIQAGPVELQFLMVSASAQPNAVALAAPAVAAAAAAPALALAFEQGAAEEVAPQDKTAFAPPALYRAGQHEATQVGVSPGAHTYTAAFGSVAPEAPPAAADAPASPKDKIRQKIDQGVAWFNAQPKQKKIMYASAAAVLLLAVVTGLMPAEKGTTQVAVTPPEGRAPASEGLEKANAAASPDISPEFLLLPAEQQKKIRDLYAKAERAQSDKEWQVAYDSAKSILDHVKRYKNAAEIVQEAQIHLNEGHIGNVSRSLSNLKDAEREADEQVNLLLASGEKALEESRWDDAETSFTKALNLAPNNQKALDGFAAARKRVRAAKVELPKPAPPPDPDADARVAERDEIDGLKRQFQDARARMNDGKFREALPILKGLDQKLYDRLAEYKSGKRAPASIRTEFSNDTMALQSRVKEGIDTIKTQLRAEYQAQLADAEQFESNRQYAQAREIYDRIIKAEPAFDEAVESRSKLYVKILAEAKTVYQESLIYESVGDIENATDGFNKTRDLLTNVHDIMAVEYHRRASNKLKRLQR